MNRHTQPIPILVDNSLNKAYTIKYALFSLFGLAGFLTDIPAISEMSGETVASIVGAVIFISAGLASFAAWRTERGPYWRQLETYAAITFVSFASIYSFDLIWLASNGDPGRTAVAVLSLALMTMPIWRVRWLIRRARST